MDNNFYVLNADPVKYDFNGKEVSYTNLTLTDDENNVCFAKYYGKEPVVRDTYVSATVYIKKDHSLGVKITKGE